MLKGQSTNEELKTFNESINKAITEQGKLEQEKSDIR
jgi:hypothetical protein